MNLVTKDVFYNIFLTLSEPLFCTGDFELGIYLYIIL